MQFNIVTIFPQIFNSYFNAGVIGRARRNKKIKIKIHNLRDYTADKRKTVDCKPYGGGVGMILKVEPVYRAIKAIKTKHKIQNAKYKTILLSAKGKRFDQQMARRWRKLNQVILICGRYEGVDERVKRFVDEEISIGDYILTGGEIPAMVIVDAISRLIPGVLGKDESNQDESHSKKGWLEYPHYTRPAEFKYIETKSVLRRGSELKCASKKSQKVLKVPMVLLSGNHREIKKWREKNKVEIITH